MTLWEVWVFVTAVLWVILTIRDGEFRLEPNPLLLPMLALLLVAIVQVLFDVRSAAWHGSTFPHGVTLSERRPQPPTQGFGNRAK